MSNTATVDHTEAFTFLGFEGQTWSAEIVDVLSYEPNGAVVAEVVLNHSYYDQPRKAVLFRDTVRVVALDHN